MINRETLTDFYHRIVGYIETDTVTGNKVGKDFYNRKVGSYDKNLNITRDFYNRIVSNGDTLASLVMQSDSRRWYVFTKN